MNTAVSLFEQQLCTISMKTTTYREIAYVMALLKVKGLTRQPMMTSSFLYTHNS